MSDLTRHKSAPCSVKGEEEGESSSPENPTQHQNVVPVPPKNSTDKKKLIRAQRVRYEQLRE